MCLFLRFRQVKSYFVIVSGLHLIMLFKRTLLRFDMFVSFELKRHLRTHCSQIVTYLSSLITNLPYLESNLPNTFVSLVADKCMHVV